MRTPPTMPLPKSKRKPSLALVRLVKLLAETYVNELRDQNREPEHHREETGNGLQHKTGMEQTA